MRLALFLLVLLLSFCLLCAFGDSVRIENGQAWVTFSNVPPCFTLEASFDLVEWHTMATLSQGGFALGWQELTFRIPVNETNLFWRVRPRECCF